MKAATDVLRWMRCEAEQAAWSMDYGRANRFGQVLDELDSAFRKQAEQRASKAGKTGRQSGKNAFRNQQIVERFKSGENSRELGRRYGVTHQRIWQILGAHGLSKKDGGAHLVAREKVKRKSQRRNDRYLSKYGYSYTEYTKLLSHPDAPRTIFGEKQRNAKRDGIPWSLTFREWWEAWQASGNWKERGLGAGRYVMTFRDKSRGFCADNILIIEHGESSRLARAREAANREAAK